MVLSAIFPPPSTGVFTESNYPQVATFADLPSATGITGTIYAVDGSTGLWPLNRKPAGLYRSNGTVWNWLGDIANDATEIAVTPTGGIASTTVQAALAELDTKKEPSIAAGIAAQYWRGDKSWQTLNSAAAGLANVDNTSDANKPLSTADTTALAGKEPTITGSGAAGDYWSGAKAFRALDAGMAGVMANGVNISWTYDGVAKTLTPSLIGTIAAARLPQFTGGDVTSAGAGSVSLTLGAGAVTLAKMAALAANSFMGNNTGAPATPIALTAAQAKALLGITEADVTNLSTDLAAKAPLASPQFTGVTFYQQVAPTAVNTTSTLTIANLLTLIITTTSASAVSLTLPTGTLTDAGISALAVNEAFEWYLINLGSSTGAATLVAGTAHTIVGNAVTAISTSSRWLTRKTATNTFVTYRIA